MKNYTPLIMFLISMLLLMGGGFAYFYIQFLPSPKKAIICKNDWSTISFMINEETGALTMAGQIVDPKTISIMNDTAISAEWKHKDGAQTKIFLDRIAGELEVQTKPDPFSEVEKEKFKCQHSNVRF